MTGLAGRGAAGPAVAAGGRALYRGAAGGLGAAVGAAVLLALLTAAVTARRPAAVLGREDYLQQWSALHGGVDPHANRLTAGYLSVVHRGCAPLARAGVWPDVLTAIGVLVTAAALAPAAAAGRWLVLAAVLVAVAGVLDNVDGAVAVMSGRVTRFGYVLDSVTDRVADGLGCVALWLAGAPAGLVVGAAAALLLLEYTRARAGAGGLADAGVITPAERPTRVLITAFALLWAGVLPAERTVAVTVMTAALLLAGVGSWLQLLIVVRRRLIGAPADPAAS